MSWYIGIDRLTHADLPELLPRYVPPYPSGVWYIDGNNLTHNALPELLDRVSPPYLAGIWYVQGNTLSHTGLPEIIKEKVVDNSPKEYFNVSTAAYKTTLKNNSVNRYLLKIELLTYQETVIGEITKDILVDVQGQININYKQLTRRSCSLTVANVEQKYIPSPNNPIWYQRKFKLWIGIEDKDRNIYWWSQGIFYVSSATGNAHTLSIEAVDKGGALDGTLKTNMADAQYVIEAGSSITDIIRDTLTLNIGNNEDIQNANVYGAANLSIDPIVPLIDMQYNNQCTMADISIDANNYLGDLLVSVADSYGADIYYDTEGHLRLEALADVFYIDGYRRMGHQWDFIDLSANFSEASYEYNFDGINAVTVYTNLSTDITALANAQEENKTGSPDDDMPERVENISYTAYNTNPQSPLQVGAIGIRRMPNQEIDYIDTDQSDMESRCQQYAVMLLQKESLKGMNVSFSCPIIPHLDVNKTIGLSDEYQNIDNGTFVIQSITIPLGAGAMKVSATNVNWLPVDLNIEESGVG